jgi:hypothetical protein
MTSGKVNAPNNKKTLKTIVANSCLVMIWICHCSSHEAVNQNKKDMVETRQVNKNEKAQKKTKGSPIELRRMGAHCSEKQS